MTAADRMEPSSLGGGFGRWDWNDEPEPGQGHRLLIDPSSSMSSGDRPKNLRVIVEDRDSMKPLLPCGPPKALIWDGTGFVGRLGGIMRLAIETWSRERGADRRPVVLAILQADASRDPG